MSLQETIQKIQEDYKARSEYIKDTLDAKTQKIDELREKLDSLERDGIHSPKWVQSQHKLIMQKIEKANEETQAWIDKQKESVEQWLADRIKEMADRQAAIELGVTDTLKKTKENIAKKKK